MKKQIFTVILLLMGGVSTFGQSFKLDATGANDMRLRTNNTDRVNILTNGNVGINTTTPDAKLHLNGDLILSPYTYTPPSSFTGDPFSRVGKSYMSLNPPTGVITTIKGIDGGTIDRYGLMLFISCGGAGTVILKHNNSTVAANKINTNTGADITITGRGGATLVYDADGWRVISYDNGGSSGWAIAGNTGTNPATDFIGTTDAQPLAFKTNNVERMRVLNTGNVGIGTNNPDSKLHLANTSTGQTAAANTILTIENNGDANLNFLSGNTTSSKGGILFGSASGNTKGQINYTPSLNRMAFATNDVTRMSIDGTGNVGIGTTTPTAKLEVDGDLKLNGSLKLRRYNNINSSGTVTINALDIQDASVYTFGQIGEYRINGIAGGEEGRILYLVTYNNSTMKLRFVNSNAASGDRIVTPMGSEITCSVATLIYTNVGFWFLVSYN